MSIKIYTIGFAKTPASDFFNLLKNENLRSVIDVRLNNESQLSGFTKKRDLGFFLREISDIEYTHAPELAPTKEILDDYRKFKGSWAVYEERFMELMYKRGVEKTFRPKFFDGACLLCSEKLPHQCHRRLVADYLKVNWSIPVEVKHLFSKAD